MSGSQRDRCCLWQQGKLASQEYEVMLTASKSASSNSKGRLAINRGWQGHFHKVYYSFSLGIEKHIPVCLTVLPVEWEARVMSGCVSGGSQANWQIGQPDVRGQRWRDIPRTLQQYVSSVLLSSGFQSGHLVSVPSRSLHARWELWRQLGSQRRALSPWSVK